MDDVATALSALAEPVGVAALFALAIWVGGRVVLAAIEAAAKVEEARIGVQRAMADAVHAQAVASGELARGLEDLRREAAETGISTRVLIQRAGVLRGPDDDATGE